MAMTMEALPCQLYPFHRQQQVLGWNYDILTDNEPFESIELDDDSSEFFDISSRCVYPDNDPEELLKIDREQLLPSIEYFTRNHHDQYVNNNNLYGLELSMLSEPVDYLTCTRNDVTSLFDRDDVTQTNLIPSCVANEMVTDDDEYELTALQLATPDVTNFPPTPPSESRINSPNSQRPSGKRAQAVRKSNKSETRLTGSNISGHVIERRSPDSTSSSPTKKPQRYRRRSTQKQQHLWEFLLETLNDPTYNPSCIEWVDRQRGIFRFVESQKVARLWGARRHRDNMSYEYFSRAMRHYYARDIMSRVCGRRLVYQFGPNATGWQLPN